LIATDRAAADSSGRQHDFARQEDENAMVGDLPVLETHRGVAQIEKQTMLEENLMTDLGTFRLELLEVQQIGRT